MILEKNRNIPGYELALQGPNDTFISLFGNFAKV
jgi:hypothetical protein